MIGCEAATETSDDRPAQENYSEIPLSQSEADDIRAQIEQNWTLGELAGTPEVKGIVVELRIFLLSDGTVTDVKLLNDRSGDATFRQVADSAIRAAKISSPVKLPPGREFRTMILRFRPDWVQS